MADTPSNNKFLFDLNNFDPEVPVEEEEEEYIEPPPPKEPPPPPPPTFSIEELEAAKSMAFEQGRSEGIKEEKTSRQQMTHDVLQNLSEKMVQVLAAERYREKQYERESLKLSLVLIEQLIPKLNQILGTEALQEKLKVIIAEQSGNSNLSIKTHPDNTNPIEEELKKLSDNRVINGNYDIYADDTIDISGCDITWSDGGAIRDPKATIDKAKKVILELLDHDKTNLQIQKTQESYAPAKEDKNT